MMPRPDRYVSRSDLGWGRSPAAAANPKLGLVIHYDGSNQNLAAKTHAACISYWKNTRAFHTGPARGWADIGYSWGVCPHAYVFEGRGLYKTQAAQPGGNTTYYSVTLMCGPTDTITDVQINAVRQLRAWLMETAGIAGTVKGHRDFVSTSCPGDALYRMVRDGVFSKPATWGGTSSSWEELMLGLKKGDRGEAVEALQELIRLAGHGAALGPAGVDGVYGDGTAEGLRLCRADVGSRALPGYGDQVTGHAFAQLIAAVAKHQATKVSGGSTGGVPRHLEVESLTAKRLTVG